MAILLLLVLLAAALPSCMSRRTVQPAPVRYRVMAGSGSEDREAAEYLRDHLSSRSALDLLSSTPGENVIDVTVHVNPDLRGDYQVRYLSENSLELSTCDRRTMTWLMYQFIKYAGQDTGYITVDDLPPCIFPRHDTLATFPFEYRDIYMPTNQNPDMTELLGLHNLESDWGLWGHQLSKVLGTMGDDFFGYQNLDQELFARTGGRIRKEQFCFSSELLYELTERYIIDQYGEGTDRSWNITIAPEDNRVVCLCPRCVAAGNLPAIATPAVVAFVERLAVRFPRHQFFIPAYSTTLAPPDHKLPDNVGVFLSAMGYPRAWDNADTPQAQSFFRILEAWQKVTDKVYIWDYICNFDDYLSPYPILFVMQQRFREYIARGVKGIFLNGSGYFYSTLQEAYSFVLSDLLADPDADVSALLKAYFNDAMPHVGTFFSTVLLHMEEHAARSGTELPLYGGIDDAVNTYLFEREFRMEYARFIELKDRGMTHRERVIYDKTRQIVSFSYLELCRLRGIGPGGFAELRDGVWEVKPDVFAALNDLKEITPEEDIYILTDNENASPDHMDRVNETGIYIADYENECQIWLESGWWKRNLLLGEPLKVTVNGNTTLNTRLTDGVTGISQNYHWGWEILPQDGLVIELPSEKLDRPAMLYFAMMNFEQHRMSLPLDIALHVDGKLLAHVQREGLTEYVDDGEKIVYKLRIGRLKGSKVELVFHPSNKPNIAIDEIFVIPQDR